MRILCLQRVVFVSACVLIASHPASADPSDTLEAAIQVTAAETITEPRAPTPSTVRQWTVAELEDEYSQEQKQRLLKIRRAIVPTVFITSATTIVISGIARGLACTDAWFLFYPELDKECLERAGLAAGPAHGVVSGTIIYLVGNSGARLSGWAAGSAMTVAVLGGVAGAFAARAIQDRTPLGAFAANAALTAVPASLLAALLLKPDGGEPQSAIQLNFLPSQTGAGGQLVGTLTLR